MTTETYIMCFLAGILGIAFHVFAVKVPSTKKRTEVANMKFDLAAYLKSDFAGIISSVLTVIILIVLANELTTFKPEVLPYIKTLFVFVGFTGSSILIAILGKASDKLNKVVDIKTNIADETLASNNATQ